MYCKCEYKNVSGNERYDDANVVKCMCGGHDLVKFQTYQFIHNNSMSYVLAWGTFCYTSIFLKRRIKIKTSHGVCLDVFMFHDGIYRALLIITFMVMFGLLNHCFFVMIA